VAAAGGVLALTDPGARPPVAAAAPAAPTVMLESTTRQAAPAPTRVRIPSLGVDSTLAPLGIDAAGALVPPEDFDQAGWFTGGPAPGEVGPAVVAGHVDSWTGPAVFAALAGIAVDDLVVVDRADGTTVRFAVTRVERYSKDDFPTEQVYGPTPAPELRLITCGGAFDRQQGSYRDNVVVYATLAEDDRPAT
jgi:hypothetical protein